MTRPTPPAPPFKKKPADGTDPAADPATGPATGPAAGGDPNTDPAAAAEPEQTTIEDPALAENPPKEEGAPASNLTRAQQAMLNEDWIKVAAWDVTTPDGEPVTTLDALVKALGAEDRQAAATELLGNPAAAAAPPELLVEATAEVHPDPNQVDLFDELFGGEFPAGGLDDGQDTGDGGEPSAGGVDEEATDPEDIADGGADEDTEDESDDGKPAFLKKGANPFAKGPKGKGPDTGAGTRKETIAAGAFVSGPFGKGKVEVVVTNGKVPGIDTDIEGTASAPAVRIRVYEESDGDWRATDKRVGAKASGLKTIPPLGAARFGKKSGAAGLVLLTAQARRLPADEQPTAEALREVYSRGVKSWPGAAVTALTAQDWGLGRAEAFLQKCQGIGTEGYVGDDDLLP